MRSVRWWFVGLVAMTLASPASAQVAGFSSLGLPAQFSCQETPASRVPGRGRIRGCETRPTLGYFRDRTHARRLLRRGSFSISVLEGLPQRLHQALGPRRLRRSGGLFAEKLPHGSDERQSTARAGGGGDCATQYYSVAN